MSDPTLAHDSHDAVVERIDYDYDGVFDTAEVVRAVEHAHRDLAERATVHTYLTVLVERLARERLVAAAQADGRIAKQVPELLFMCVHNAGRSQLAAAIADHLAGGRVHVRTAGSKPSGEINPDVVTVLRERGISIDHAFPKPLVDDVVHAADVIVTMGCGDECPYFPGKQYEDWQIPDPALATSLDEVREIRDRIQAEVTTLLRSLGV